ncbi:nucleotide exchange factor GrpE [Thermodesulfobacteriota bacterium]
MTDKAKKQMETDDVRTDEKNGSQKDSVKKATKKTVASLKAIKAKLESKEQEAKENYDRFLRVSAEFENYKKRSARQMDEFRRFANESLIMQILAVVDSLERALNSSGHDENFDNCMMEGIQMTLDEILKIFEKFGVKPIDSLEQTFDPNFHQAVMQEETNDYPEQTVLKELQKGYLLHDRLLRPAMVVVSKQTSGVKSKNE